MKLHFLWLRGGNSVSSTPRIGILALQGAFIEHQQILKRLNVSSFEIRQLSDLDQPFDGLILPGGESTTQGKLLKDLGLFYPLQQKIRAGLPTLATCAGLILLAEHLVDDPTVHLGTMPVSVKRNAYGRQLGSFFTEETFGTLGKIPMTFIRAPYIEEADANVEILSKVNNHIVAARYQNQLGLSFHPELNESTQIHEYFLNMI